MATSLFAGLLVIVAASTMVVASGQPPKQIHPSQGMTIVDYEPAPNTFEELWDQAPVVARVMTRTSTIKAIPSGSVHLTPVTIHTADVLEVFKNTSTQPVVYEIAIIQPGGTIDDHGIARTAHTGDFPVIKAGEELIVFLIPSQTMDGFHVLYGPAGAYVVRGNGVVIPPRVSHYSAFRGHDVVEKSGFLRIIQQLKNRRAK